MTNSPDILIVTPTLGNRRTLVDTCKNVQAFGGDRVHHIVTCPPMRMNAASEMTGGAEVIEEGAGEGVYGAVNHVLRARASNYEWVGYVNDDDYWMPGMKELINQTMESSAMQVLYGRVLYVNHCDKPLMVSSCSARYKSYPILAARGIFIFTQQATLIRKSLYLQLGGFDERFSLVADADFWIRAIKAGACFRLIDKVCAVWRLHPGQLSGDRTKQAAEIERLLHQHGLSGDNWRARIEAARYRLENSRLYLSRLLNLNGSGYRIRDYLG